jgi:hypothetical protein
MLLRNQGQLSDGTSIFFEELHAAGATTASALLRSGCGVFERGEPTCRRFEESG